MIEASMGKEVQSDNLWEFVGTWFVLQGENLPSWEEFKKLNKKNILRRNQQNTKDNFSVRESIPDWLFELGADELGAAVWMKEVETMNQSADIVIEPIDSKPTKSRFKK